jgi:ubiquinol-cytochrome c reductase cytochrome c subunit
MCLHNRGKQINMTGVTLTILNAFLMVALASASILVPAQNSAAPSGGNSQNGKRIFEKLGCLRCHGSAGEGMPQTGKEPGPSKIASTHLSLQDFVQFVRAPKGQMPPFSPAQVNDGELADVYAFLQTVVSQPKVELPSSANAQNGQHLYSAFGCYECHGLQGQGSTQTGGSRIGPPQIPFSSFVAYVREPTNQMPPYSSKVVSEGQLADIYVFLQTRPKALPSKSIPLLNQ